MLQTGDSMKYEITLDVVKKVRDIVYGGFYDPEDFRFAKFDLEQGCSDTNFFFFKILEKAMDHYILKCNNVPLFDETIEDKKLAEGQKQLG